MSLGALVRDGTLYVAPPSRPSHPLCPRRFARPESAVETGSLPPRPRDASPFLASSLVPRPEVVRRPQKLEARRTQTCPPSLHFRRKSLPVARALSFSHARGPGSGRENDHNGGHHPAARDAPLER